MEPGIRLPNNSFSGILGMWVSWIKILCLRFIEIPFGSLQLIHHLSGLSQNRWICMSNSINLTNSMDQWTNSKNSKKVPSCGTGKSARELASQDGSGPDGGSGSGSFYARPSIIFLFQSVEQLQIQPRFISRLLAIFCRHYFGLLALQGDHASYPIWNHPIWNEKCHQNH